MIQEKVTEEFCVVLPPIQKRKGFYSGSIMQYGVVPKPGRNDPWWIVSATFSNRMPEDPLSPEMLFDYAVRSPASFLSAIRFLPSETADGIVAYQDAYMYPTISKVFRASPPPFELEGILSKICVVIKIDGRWLVSIYQKGKDTSFFVRGSALLGNQPYEREGPPIEFTNAKDIVSALSFMFDLHVITARRVVIRKGKHRRTKIVDLLQKQTAPTRPMRDYRNIGQRVRKKY